MLLMEARLLRRRKMHGQRWERKFRPSGRFENLKGWISGAYYSSEMGMRELGWTEDRVFGSFPGCEHRKDITERDSMNEFTNRREFLRAARCGAGLALSNRLLGESNKSVLVFTKSSDSNTPCENESTGTEHHGGHGQSPGRTARIQSGSDQGRAHF